MVSEPEGLAVVLQYVRAFAAGVKHALLLRPEAFLFSYSFSSCLITPCWKVTSGIHITVKTEKLERFKYEVSIS